MYSLSLSIIVLFNCTGCSFDEVVETIQSIPTQAELQVDSYIGMSASTSEAYTKYKNKLDSNNNTTYTSNPWKAVIGIFDKSQTVKFDLFGIRQTVDETQLANYKIEYEDNKANDLTYTSNKNNYITKGIIAVLVVIVLLLIILLLLRSRRKKVAGPTVVVSQPAATVIPQVNTTGQLTVDYDSLLTAVCTKGGVSVAEVLPHFSNSRAAYEKVNILVGKGKTGQEILNSI